jgi:tetratricopeptide (TPR) repeat protein
MNRNACCRFVTILVHAFFFSLSVAQAQFTFSPHCRDAYRSMLELRFEDARKSLDAEKISSPSNLFPVYLENYIDFLTVFIGEERGLFEKFREDRESRMRRIEKGDPDSPYHRYCLGSMHLQWAVLRMKFGESRAALADIARAHSDLVSNRGKYPSFLPNEAPLGFIHIMAGLVPDSYRWLVDLTGIDGDVIQGTQEIGRVASYRGGDEFFRIARTEALFFLALSDAFTGNERKDALALLQRLETGEGEDPDPANPLFIFTRATILMKYGRNDEALRTLEKYTIRPGDYPFYFLDYLTGKAKQNRLDPDADRYLIRFLKNFGGVNYIKSAYLRLAWSSILDGHPEKYREYAAKVLTRGNTYMDVDNQALREAGEKEMPDTILLRARLLSDGGYYDRALAEMLRVRPSGWMKTPKQNVEYPYRLARIYQEKGEDQKALDYFGVTLGRSEGLPYYFGGNAALQSGLICEKNGDYRRAGYFYNRCLSLDFLEYKTGLDQKARAGLKRIRKFLD